MGAKDSSRAARLASSSSRSEVAFCRRLTIDRSRDRDADWRVIGGEEIHSVHVRIPMYSFYMYGMHTLLCIILDVA